MSAEPVGLTRRVYRRGLAWLPTNAQIRVKRGLLSARHAIRSMSRRSRGRGLIDIPGGRRGETTLLVSALGVDDAGLAAAAAHAVRLRAAGAPVLVLTDCDAFGELRRHDLPFEYVPPPSDHAAVLGGDYAAFLEQRGRRLQTTWRPGAVVDAGAVAPPASLGRVAGRAGDQ